VQSLTGHNRWHSRAAFLTTTLMVLVTIGGPFQVTAGLLAHGALFLPATLLLLYVLGTPLTRVALAIGQMHTPLSGRDAMVTVQWLLRAVLAGTLLLVSARAAGWIFAGSAFELAPDALAYQARELTSASTQWHGAPTNAFIAGAGCVVGFSVLLGLIARRARLTALAWLGGPLLGAFVGLMLLGVFVAYSMPGAGALAAVSAPLRLEALILPAFWVDAGRIALLATGAQAGVVVAAGGGLPGKAEIGREARVLVCGIGFVLVITGLAGLLLLCGLCVDLGLVPQPEHARPTILLVDLVPALGERLFVSWPAEWRPSARRVTVTWCFMIALAGSFGAAALMVSRSPLPDDWRSRASRLGFAAAVVVAMALGFSWYQGGADPLVPLLASLPALLAWMRLTLARRAGAGLRVAKAAFEARTPWLEQMHFTLAFRVARPLLLGLVVLAAVSQRVGGLVLAAVAISFALMWLGSLQAEPLRKTTMRLPRVATLAFMLAASSLHAQQAAPRFDFDGAHAALVAERDVSRRRQLRVRFEEEVFSNLARMPRSQIAFDSAVARDAVRQRYLALIKPQAADADVLTGQVQDAMATLLLIDESMDAQLLEHQVLSPGTQDAQQLLGLIDGSSIRDPKLMLELMDALHRRLGNQPEPSAGIDTAAWLVPLVTEMRQAWGTAGPEARIIRRELVASIVRDRSLLLPQAGAGTTYLLCFAVTSVMLALALLLARGSARLG